MEIVSSYPGLPGGGGFGDDAGQDRVIIDKTVPTGEAFGLDAEFLHPAHQGDH